MRARNVTTFAARAAFLLAMTAALPALADDAMTMHGKSVQITFENLTTGQPFSPSYFQSRGAEAAPLFKLGDKASDALVAVAEGGNIGMFSVGAAKDMGQTLGDAVLAIHALPGQTRSVIITVDEKHPLIDGAWMLGNTNDGFSGFAGIDGWTLDRPMTIEVRGYDAGSEVNNEKKGYLGALGGGNMRDPENGVIAYHAGIRGDADAPKDWNWDVKGPVARVTITPLPMTGDHGRCSAAPWRAAPAPAGAASTRTAPPSDLQWNRLAGRDYAAASPRNGATSSPGRKRPTRLISHSSRTPLVASTRARTVSPRRSRSAAVAAPVLIRKLQCISETMAPPMRRPRQPAASMSCHALPPGGLVKVEPPVFSRIGWARSRCASTASIAAWISAWGAGVPWNTASVKMRSSGAAEWR